MISCKYTWINIDDMQNEMDFYSYYNEFEFNLNLEQFF